MFVITTDGMENASSRYSSDEVKKMIEREKREYGWEFLFIGANIDAVETAARFGINRDRAVNYNTVAEAVCCARANIPLSEDWGEEIEEDCKMRRCKKK